jgi:hypothetical protein
VTEKKVFEFVVADDAVFVKRVQDLYRYTFDGAKPESTFAQDWAKLSKLPERVTKILDKKYKTWLEIKENCRKFLSDEVPERLEYEDVTCRNEYGDLVWIQPVAHLESMYEQKSEELPAGEEEIEFENVVLCNWCSASGTLLLSDTRLRAKTGGETTSASNTSASES